MSSSKKTGSMTRTRTVTRSSGPEPWGAPRSGTGLGCRPGCRARRPGPSGGAIGRGPVGAAVGRGSSGPSAGGLGRQGHRPTSIDPTAEDAYWPRGNYHSRPRTPTRRTDYGRLPARPYPTTDGSLGALHAGKSWDDVEPELEERLGQGSEASPGARVGEGPVGPLATRGRSDRPGPGLDDRQVSGDRKRSPGPATGFLWQIGDGFEEGPGN